MGIHFGKFIAVSVGAALVFCLAGHGVAAPPKEHKKAAQTQSPNKDMLRRIAKALGAQISATWSAYAELIEKMKRDHLPVKPLRHPDYGVTEGGIPLPSAFHNQISDLAQHSFGTHTSYVKSLWPINPTRGPRDHWEKQALEFLTRSKDKKAFREKLSKPSSYARYYAMYPVVASHRVCVDCHNGHRKSKKRNFQVGDVIGGLVISLPVREGTVKK